jgi:rubrerythrin
MPVLKSEPPAMARSLEELIGVALAMEEEARRRYLELSELMDARSEPDIAATFRMLAEEESGHVDRAAAWGRNALAKLPEAQRFAWRLPSDIAASWDELAHSSLLTPYRALALAVANEERAFAYYTYLAAGAESAAVREAAEGLAGEELRHAALLRRERRKAWHRENPHSGPSAAIATPEELAQRAAPLLAEAAAIHLALGAALAASDPAGAGVLREVAAAEAKAAGPTQGAHTPSLPQASAPAEALRHALMPLERLSELFENAALHAPSEALLAAAQAGLERTVAHLARLVQQLGRDTPDR